jgi:hypothetical protein
MEDLTTDAEFGTGEDAATDTALSNQFVHPGYTFKGQKLRPYTAGTDLLFLQILDRENDAPFTIFLAFIFIHVHDREKLVKLCWDKFKFREALLTWIDSLGALTNEDKQEAMKLFEDVRGWAQKSAVETIDAPQKKTKATRRPRSRG